MFQSVCCQNRAHKITPNFSRTNTKENFKKRTTTHIFFRLPIALPLHFFCVSPKVFASSNNGLEIGAMCAPHDLDNRQCKDIMGQWTGYRDIPETCVPGLWQTIVDQEMPSRRRFLPNHAPPPGMRCILPPHLCYVDLLICNLSVLFNTTLQ